MRISVLVSCFILFLKKHAVKPSNCSSNAWGKDAFCAGCYEMASAASSPSAFSQASLEGPTNIDKNRPVNIVYSYDPVLVSESYLPSFVGTANQKTTQKLKMCCE